MNETFLLTLDECKGIYSSGGKEAVIVLLVGILIIVFIWFILYSQEHGGVKK